MTRLPPTTYYLLLTAFVQRTSSFIGYQESRQ